MVSLLRAGVMVSRRMVVRVRPEIANGVIIGHMNCVQLVKSTYSRSKLLSDDERSGVSTVILSSF